MCEISRQPTHYREALLGVTYGVDDYNPIITELVKTLDVCVGKRSYPYNFLFAPSIKGPQLLKLATGKLNYR
jgi:hypothetical protein